jgi:hypothetical protein
MKAKRACSVNISPVLKGALKHLLGQTWMLVVKIAVMKKLKKRAQKLFGSRNSLQTDICKVQFHKGQGEEA